MHSAILAALSALAPAAIPVSEPGRASVTGQVRFNCDDNACAVPERYRLEPHAFSYESRLKYDLSLSGVEVHELKFPSAVISPHPVNNIVHAEYFKPKKDGKFPAVVVLDILDGKGLVSRGTAMWLAQHDIPALAVTMPYYGPRRPAEGRHRMLSTDVPRSLENVRQTVLDCRRAVAWLAEQPEVDAERLGIVGTSLGSFLGGLTAASEPRLRSVCLLLGGGGLVDAFADHPRAGFVIQALRLVGIGKADLKRMIAPADPLTYSDRLKEKRLLLIAASRDDVVPPAAMTRLWEATGKPKILWFDATHVGAVVHIFPAMEAVIAHVKE